MADEAAVTATPASAATPTPAVADNGLGLGAFLSSSSSPTPTPSEPTTADTPKTGAPSTTAPASVETKTTDKPADMPAATTPATPTIDWEADTNPYKGYKKRYEDTARWGNSVNQKLAEITRQVTVQGKKLDGTYDPQTDEPGPPDPEFIADRADKQARVHASVAAAEQIYGKDRVHALIFAENAPFRAFDNDAAVQARVLTAPAPVLEAIRVVEEHAFFSKYGRDPEKIRDNIRSEFKDELMKDIDKLVDDRLKERLKVKDGSGVGLSTARGAGTPDAEPGKPTRTPLSSIGNTGLAG